MPALYQPLIAQEPLRPSLFQSSHVDQGNCFQIIQLPYTNDVLSTQWLALLVHSYKNKKINKVGPAVPWPKIPRVSRIDWAAPVL
jgi:hypothetical protein